MPRTRPNDRSGIGSVEIVLSSSAESPESPRADEMGPHAQNSRWELASPRSAIFGLNRAVCAPAQILRVRAHFVGLGRFWALNPTREHNLYAPDVRSDIMSGAVALATVL